MMGKNKLFVPIFFKDFDSWFRIRLLKLFINSLNNINSIADIGGGSGKLERILNLKDIIIIDQNKDSIKEASKYFKQTFVNKGNKLQFPENIFNWSISLHTIEHIPIEDRKDFILEIIRVSKNGILLNFPFGNYSTKLCKNYLNALKKRKKEPNIWTQEHLQRGLPRTHEIEEILNKQKKFYYKLRTVRNYYIENLLWKNLASSNYLIKAINITILPLFSFSFRYVKPTLELVVICSKSEEFNKSLLKKI